MLLETPMKEDDEFSERGRDPRYPPGTGAFYGILLGLAVWGVIVLIAVL